MLNLLNMLTPTQSCDDSGPLNGNGNSWDQSLQIHSGNPLLVIKPNETKTCTIGFTFREWISISEETQSWKIKTCNEQNIFINNHVLPIWIILYREVIFMKAYIEKKTYICNQKCKS